MSEGHGEAQRETVIRSLVGDETVLCVLLAVRGKQVAIINARYPAALAHAETHLSNGFGRVRICTPECAG